MKIKNVLLSSVVIFCAFARAAEAPVETPDSEESIAEVAVNGTRNPALKPYRALSAGLDAFDQYRALAPNATLQFKLSKRAEFNQYKGSWDGVSLRLAGNGTSIPVPIGADGKFTLPRSKEAYEDDADLIVNQKKSVVRFSPDVRTPGLPANVRRLGDLRLECKVLVAIGKNELSFAQRAAISMIALGDWCSPSFGKIWFSSPGWSMHTTIVHGGKRTPLNSYGYQFNAPLGDKSLPDDALLEFEFWSDASAERKKQFLALWPFYLKSSVNKWGPGPAFELKESARYSAVMPLKPGKWRFHVDSKDREIGLGANAGKGHVALGLEHALEWEGEALQLEVEQAGTYEFSLDLQNPDRPVATIRRADAAASVQ